MVDSGRGAGWHHCTSLPAPALSWYSSYYRPGWLTTGFDAWVEHCRFSNDKRTLEATLRLNGTPGRESIVLCGVLASANHRATVDGAEVRSRVLSSGAVEVRIPRAGGVRHLVLS